MHSNDGEEISQQTVPVTEAVGMVLAHDITEIRKDEFKGAAFKKGHRIAPDDICKLQRIGKERVYILDIPEGHMHEDEAAEELARALMGEGLAIQGPPREGKINIVAARDGLFKVDKDSLLKFNMTGDVMCATMHSNTAVTRGQVVAGTRAIPLVVSKDRVGEAVNALAAVGSTLKVNKIRKPRAGVVITGNEVYQGKVKDAFGPVIREKIESFTGEIAGLSYCPDDKEAISKQLEEHMRSGADILITTGGMSVDPDDVTRFAIRDLGADDIAYGSAVLPGAMILVAYVDNPWIGQKIPVIGIPACGMYHKATVFDLVLPRVLAGETIGRRELAEYGHGGMCLQCKECRFPVCPLGK
jgi:molybdenum cofactor synthesis domain-containing protein